MERSYFSVTNENIVIETIKPAEDNDGTIVRLYESSGQNIHTVFKTDFEYESFSEVTMDELYIKTSNGHLKFTPFEVKTFRIR